MMKLSIIIPVYNVEKYIEKCICSLINQKDVSVNDVEIIIIDDGSSDMSINIAQKILQKSLFQYCIYVQENDGQGSARNKGILNSQGTYIMFLDSDDYLREDTISKVMNEMVNEPDVIVYDVNVVNEIGEVLKIKREWSICTSEDSAKYFFSGGPCNKVFKKSLFIDNKVFFPSKVWYEDLRTVHKILMFTKKILYIKEPFYNYVQRQGSTMNNLNFDKNLDILLALEDLEDFFDKNRVGNHQEFEILVLTHQIVYAINRIAKYDPFNRNVKVLRERFFSKYKQTHKNKYFAQVPNRVRISYYIVKYRLQFIFLLLNYRYILACGRKFFLNR